MSEFTLPKKIVYIKPIIKKGNWLNEGHSGNFMYDNAKLIVTVPVSADTGELVDPLTKEEREFFESKELSGLDFNKGDLSVYKKTNQRTGDYNYWHIFEYRIIKNQGIVTDKTELDRLDLSKPMDYLKFKLLMANSGFGGIVAPSWDARFDQGTYRIALVDSDYEEETSASKLDKKAEAYAFAKKISKSHTKMFEFLSVYWLENKNAKRPSIDSSVDWLKAEINKLIEDNLDEMLNVMNSNYEEKLIIHNGMKCGALRRVGTTFMFADGTPIGNSIMEAILYLRDERHNEEKLRLIAQIEAN